MSIHQKICKFVLDVKHLIRDLPQVLQNMIKWMKGKGRKERKIRKGRKV